MHNPQQENPHQPTQYHKSTTYEILQETSTNNGSTKYKLANRQVLVHGIIHIFIGVLAFIFQIVLLSAYILSGCIDGYGCGFSTFFGSGVWCGIFIIITGSFGIGAAKNKTACLIIAYMVLCIINSIVAVIVLGFGCGFISDSDVPYYSYYDYYGSDYLSYQFSMTNYQNTYVALGSLSVIMGVTELVISIWSSVLCCAAVCCCSNTDGNTRQQQVVYINGNNPAAIVYPIQACGMNCPQTTYIQDLAPVHTRPQVQPVYTQATPEQPAFTGLNDVSKPGYDEQPVNIKSVVGI